LDCNSYFLVLLTPLVPNVLVGNAYFDYDMVVNLIERIIAKMGLDASVGCCAFTTPYWVL